MAIAGILPSILQPGRLLIFLLILIIQLISGERAYWDDFNNEQYTVHCQNGLLAPGAFWRESDINSRLLRAITSTAFGQKEQRLNKTNITAVTQGNPSCIHELFICVEAKVTTPFCPMEDYKGPLLVEQRCGYFILCTKAGYCGPDNTCYLNLDVGEGETIYIYVYNITERELSAFGLEKGWQYLQSSERASRSNYIDLGLSDNSQSSVLIGFQVFSESDNLPFLDDWLPSDCFTTEESRNSCLNPITSTPNTPSLTSTIIPTTSEIYITPDPQNGNATAGMTSNGNQNSKVAIIVGSVICALLLFFIFLILAIIIKRGSLSKPNIASLRGRFSRPTTSTNSHTSNIDTYATGPYDDVALYSNTMHPNMQLYDKNKREPDAQDLEYADLTFTEKDAGVVRGEPSQVKYATIDLNAIKKMSEPVMPEVECVNAVITPKGQGYGEPEEAEYATVDLSKKKIKEPGVYMVEKEEYRTTGSALEEYS